LLLFFKKEGLIFQKKKQKNFALVTLQSEGLVLVRAGYVAVAGQRQQREELAVAVVAQI
jgi:hypothetical protein